MKSRHVVLIVITLAVMAFALVLIVDSYQAHKTKQEHARANFVMSVVRKKVKAYDQANGHYPDSLNDLIFTNSAEEFEIAPDLSNIRYTRTPNGYVMGWHGTYIQTVGH